jgi:GTPase SAR1 family protein
MLPLKKISLIILGDGGVGKTSILNMYSERRFNPKDILGWTKELVLLNFDYIDDKQRLNLNINLLNFKKNIVNGCGIYVFKKIKINFKK